MNSVASETNVNICNNYLQNLKVFDKNADNINTDIGQRVIMSSSFNLNTFLQEYKSYNAKAYTPAENGRTAMEQQEIQRAEEAVKESGLLSLTLSEKLAELGVGDRVFQQFSNTAVNMMKGLVNPITDYLEKYENIFDQDQYVSQIQAYAKQMFFANQALSEEAAENAVGQNFVFDM